MIAMYHLSHLIAEDRRRELIADARGQDHRRRHAGLHGDLGVQERQRLALVGAERDGQREVAAAK